MEPLRSPPLGKGRVRVGSPGLRETKDLILDHKITPPVLAKEGLSEKNPTQPSP